MKKNNPGGTHPNNPFQKSRVRAGVSQETAAETLGCSTRTLQRYEEVGGDPRVSVILEMMSLYKCEFSDLFPSVSDEKPPPPEEDILDYRLPMPVTSVRCYPACMDLSTYPLCPRCALPMEREYQCFCEHCGQALDWKGFSKAVIVFSHSSNGAR